MSVKLLASIEAVLTPAGFESFQGNNHHAGNLEDFKSFSRLDVLFAFVAVPHVFFVKSLALLEFSETVLESNLSRAIVLLVRLRFELDCC